MGTNVTWEHAASLPCVMMKAPGPSKITVKVSNELHAVTSYNYNLYMTATQNPELWNQANQMQNGVQMDVHIPSYSKQKVIITPLYEYPPKSQLDV